MTPRSVVAADSELGVPSYAFSEEPEVPPSSQQQLHETGEAAKAFVWSQYVEGVPFYSKEVFQELVRQFDSGGGPDGKIAVPGLNGINVYYPLRTGQRYPTRPYGPEFYLNMYDCIS